MLEYLFFSLGLVPAFAARIFTPLFFSLLFARLGPQYEWLAHCGGIEVLSRAPAWATTDGMLGTSFLFMFLELAACKSARLRSFMAFFDSKAKAAAAVGLSWFLAGSAPGAIAGMSLDSGASGGGGGWLLAFLGGGAAGPVLAFGWAMAIGLLVFLAAVLRGFCFGLLSTVDPDDDFGLGRLLSWAEDLFGIFFFVLLVALPAMAAAIAGCAILAVYVLRRLLAAREVSQKVPCPRCGAPNVPCGLGCGSCGEARSDARRIGALGFFGQRPAADLGRHRFELLGHRRCPFCGERLEGGQLARPCATCGRPPFGSPAEAEAYLRHVSSRLPRTLLVLSAWSLFPLAGLMPGIIYYRFSLIAAVQGYLPPSLGFFARWPLRALNLFLICLQPLPLLGMLVLPLMCLANFQIYRWLLRREIACQLAAAPRVPPLPGRLPAAVES